MNNNQCIYCRKESPKVSFNKVEHVIPQSFGVFNNNHTLNCVCDNCNHYFGNNLELQLARDSAEGHLRFASGIKPENEFKSLGKKSTTIVKLHEGELAGAYCYREYSSSLGRLEIKPCQQVGILNSLEKYDYYLPQDIPTFQEAKNKGYDLNRKDVFRFLPCEAIEHLTEALRKKGYTPSSSVELSLKRSSVSDHFVANCEVDFNINHSFRAMAKIAFNYFAYHYSAAIALRSEFDDIRNYIRFDKKSNDYVTPVKEPILEDEKHGEQRVVGHFILIYKVQKCNAVMSKISLFNQIYYEITLSCNYSGAINKIGHFYCPHNNEIMQLQNTPPLV